MTPRSDLLKNSSVRLMTSGFESKTMEYFKKCPKCGHYMDPEIVSTTGTIWKCMCGHIEDKWEVAYSSKIIYTGGGASGRTTYRENR